MISGVAVVIPTFDGELYISQTLDSVAEQSLQPVQVIVVGDLSRDQTCEIVRSYSKRHRLPVTLINRSINSGGPGGPLNAGIAAAQAEFIAVIEQDDLMPPNRLQRQSAALTANPSAGMVVGRRRVFYGDAEYRWPQSIDDLPQAGDEDPSYPVFDGEHLVLEARSALDRLLDANFIHSNRNVMVRKSAWQALGGFDPRWRANCDIDFALRMARHRPVVVLNALVFGYRVHHDSLWHSNQLRGQIDGFKVRLEARRLRSERTGHRRESLRSHAIRAAREGRWRLAADALLSWATFARG